MKAFLCALIYTLHSCELKYQDLFQNGREQSGVKMEDEI